MRRNSKSALWFFAIAVGLLVVGRATGNVPITRLLGILGDNTNYLILTNNSWVNEGAVTSFAAWKTTEGFNVETVGWEPILQSYSPAAIPSNAILAKTIVSASIQSGRVWLFWCNDFELINPLGTNYGMWGYIASTGWNPSPYTPPSSAKVMLIRATNWVPSFTVTYRDGNNVEHTVTAPPISGIGDYGHYALKTDGTTSLIRDKPTFLLQHINSNYPNLRHLLILGQNVPAFPCRWLQYYTTAGWFMTCTLTDTPYTQSVLSDQTSSFANDKQAVGRIPCATLADVSVVLQKTMEFQPFQSNKILYFKGPPLGFETGAWDDNYNDLFSATYNSILSMNPDAFTAEYDTPSDSTINAQMSSEKDFVITHSHGDHTGLLLGGKLSGSDFPSISFQNSAFLTVLACDAGSYPHCNLVPEALSDANSKVTVIVIPVLPAYGPNFLIRLYQALPSNDVGWAWLAAASSWETYDATINNLFGDPSLRLVDVPVQPTFGTLDFDFTVNGLPSTETVDYEIKFPNGTTKWFNEQGHFILSGCPFSTTQYVIIVYYPSGDRTYHASLGVALDVDHPTIEWVFNFNPTGDVGGTVVISANSACSVTIYHDTLYYDVKTPEFTLSGVTGTWRFVAQRQISYGVYETLEWTCDVGNDDFLSHNFVFTTIIPPVDDWLWVLFQYGLIGLVVVSVFAGVYVAVQPREVEWVPFPV